MIHRGDPRTGSGAGSNIAEEPYSFLFAEQGMGHLAGFISSGSYASDLFVLFQAFFSAVNSSFRWTFATECLFLIPQSRWKIMVSAE
jgi:hypothetical protein